MSTNKNKITLDFDESFYEQRLIDILGDTQLTAFQLGLIKDYYKCSYAKARDYATLLNDSQLDILRKHSDKGGLKGKK